MKVHRCFYLLLPSLLICFIRADCVSIAAQTNPPVQTAKKIYSVTLTPQSFQVVIKWTYTNRTKATVYARTKLHTRLALEKKVGDEWVIAKRAAIPLFSNDEEGEHWGIDDKFGSINPGGTCVGTWSINSKYLGYTRVGREGRRFELKEVPGAYRIVLGLYSTEGGEISGEMLPLEERVSNEFEFVEKE
jgi:hypothetical protein